MGLGNPLPGRIQPKSEPWLGYPTFRVTSTFAEHVASGRGPGIDFGNGGRGFPVLSMLAGNVSEILIDPGNGAKIIRVQHNLNEFSGYAHLDAFQAGLRVGTYVTRGQQLGVHGSTGATAPHLHAGYRVNCNGNFYRGTEIDFWPLLDQNIGGNEVIIVEAVKFLGADGRPALRNVSFSGGKTYVGYALDGTSERFTPSADTRAPADARCSISGRPDAPVGSPFVRITAGVFADHPYLLETQPGLVVAPDPPIGGGHTDAELVAAVRKASNQAATAVAAQAVEKAKEYPAP